VCSIDEMLHSSDSELDDDSEDDKPVRKKMKRTQRTEARGGGTWLKEDEDIVDFLDPSAVKKVLGKYISNCVKDVNHVWDSCMGFMYGIGHY